MKMAFVKCNKKYVGDIEQYYLIPMSEIQYVFIDGNSETDYVYTKSNLKFEVGNFSFKTSIREYDLSALSVANKTYWGEGFDSKEEDKKSEQVFKYIENKGK